MLKYRSFLNKAGLNILLFDLRYFGESKGDFYSLGCYEYKDAKATINFLKKEGIKSIGILAESMGGAASLEV